MAWLRKHRHLLLGALAAAFTALACAGLLTAAILVPAPTPVLVLIVAVSIGLPMRATWDLSRVTTAVPRLDPAEMRRQLDRLPETQHPLGL
jgi:CHASE2 domain-containing sensor protein